MKRLSIALFIAVVTLSASCAGGSAGAAGVKSIDSNDELNTVKTITQESFKTIVPKLMGTVMTKAEKEGYSSAVAFCNENVAGMGKEATETLGAKFKKEHGIDSFKFGRTSLKTRNPNNAPNDAQKYILKQWAEGEESGKKAEPMFVEAGGVYYGMMPIRIQSPICLGCHGTPDKVDPAAMKIIKERYPSDKATGYQLNDLRGGFWVKVDL